MFSCNSRPNLCLSNKWTPASYNCKHETEVALCRSIMTREQTHKIVKEYVLRQLEIGNEMIHNKVLEKLPADPNVDNGDRRQMIDESVKRVIRAIEAS